MLPSGLYLISAESMLRDGSFLPMLEGALHAGLRIVQMRAKNLDQQRLLEVGAQIRSLTRRHGAAFIVNDDPHLAIALEADGVHVGQGDIPPAEARRILGPAKILGYSTHNQAQIEAAQKEPVDYIGIGPVFTTATKENPDPTTGIQLLEWAHLHTALPFVAIGGITLSNLDQVLHAGAKSIAVIAAISSAPDPLAAAREFITRIENAANTAE